MMFKAFEPQAAVILARVTVPPVSKHPGSFEKWLLASWAYDTSIR
jgi:hypothetical protein